MTAAPVLLALVWLVLVGAGGWRHRPLRGRAVPAVDRSGHHGASRLGGSRLPVRSARWRIVAVMSAAAVVGVATLGLVGGVVLVGLVPVVARVRSRRAQRAGQARRLARLPEAVDLMVVAGAAGLTHRQGLALVAQRGPSELREAFAEVVARAGAGEPWAAALGRLTTTIGEPARAVVHALLAGEQGGAPVRAVLASLADDARRQRRHDLEAAVRRLPVRLSFPLVCCSLPAFVVLTVVPLVAAGLQRLAPMGV